MSKPPIDTQFDATIKRLSGIAALRHLRRIVDNDLAHETWKSVTAKRLIPMLGAVAFIAFCGLLFWYR